MKTRYTSKQKNDKREREEEIGKERANKTARVKWGRGKRESNNVNAREMGLRWVLGMS